MRQGVVRSSRGTGVDHAVVEIVYRGIRITSPIGERSSLSASAEHCKGQDEDENLSASIKRSTGDVIVLDEQLRIATTHKPLREETEDEEHGDTGIDADEQPAHVPQNHGNVRVPEKWVFGVAVSQPEGNWDDEPNEVGEGNPLVPAANREELGGHGPGYGERIESEEKYQRVVHILLTTIINVLLNILTTPDVTSRN